MAERTREEIENLAAMALHVADNALSVAVASAAMLDLLLATLREEGVLSAAELRALLDRAEISLRNARHPSLSDQGQQYALVQILETRRFLKL